MTQLINALATTTRVNAWLESTQSPRILHIFDRALNLINESQAVLSLVTPEIGNGPFNLVVPSDARFTANISLESPVSSTRDQLKIGRCIVQSQPARLWDAHPDWKALHAKREPILPCVKELAIHRSPTILHFSNSLSFSLATADLPSSISAAKPLAGLGPGLTPAGDDYIMGALYAAWIIHPHTMAEHIAREICMAAAPLTTSLSSAWLQAAGNGEAGILWHAFFEALASGEQAAVEMQFSNILSIGATSGADALAGFIDVFISYAELERKHVVSKVL